MIGSLTLDLPEPPAQSGRKGWRTKWRTKHDCKEAVWAAAVRQVIPFPDPPCSVRVHAHYRLHARRDPTNLYGDAKPVLDALKAEPAPNDRLRWRNGLWLGRGYFLDDDLLEFGDVDQEIDRDDRGLRLILDVTDESWRPPDRLEDHDRWEEP